MLNKAYGRGVCDALQKAGVIKFANEKIAQEAADTVSEAVLPQEVPGDVAPESTAALAANLAELAGALEESAGHAGAAAEEAAKSASVKQAAIWLRNKLAGPSDTGSTITGDKPDQQNDLDTSANAEATLDQQNRPGDDAYANQGVQGVGNQEASGVGAVAAEGKHPGAPAGPVSQQSSNSAIEAIKSAGAKQMLDLISKLANTTIMPHQAPVTDMATGEKELDAANRPGGMGYANKGVDGVGKSDEAAKERAAAIGTEKAHPGTMGPVGQSGTNTAIQQIATKSAAEEDYVRNFQEVANKYAGYLPPRLSDEEKIAAVRYLMGQDPVNRDKLAMHMVKTAELPEGLADYVAKEKGGDGGKEDDKKETKKEEKKEEKEEKEEKEAQVNDILERIRTMVA